MLKFFKNAKTLKIAVCFFMVMTAVFLLANFVLAAELDTGLRYAAETGLSQTDPRIVAAKVIRIALGFLGIIALGLIIYAGWLWMTSAGSEDKIEQAKTILKNAVIGLIIILSSFAIASFVLNQLIGATGANNQSGPGGNGRSGGFGAASGGAVDYTFPADGETNVSRNIGQMRAVLFEEADPRSFKDTNNATVEAYTVEPMLYRKESDNQFASLKTGGLREKFKSFFTSGQEALASAALIGEAVKTQLDVSPDGKTLILKPAEMLGSPKAATWYTVTLKSGILKANGDKLFPAVAGNAGYRWKFAVGTEIDKTPPKIVSVVPGPGPDKWARNIVAQINFSEAIDPSSASGSTEKGFDNILVLDKNGEPIKGNFYVSNQYRTVEFLTLDACGLNSCGNTIFCLPANNQIKVLVKAAALLNPGASNEANFLNKYDGIVDMAGNSLDGNGSGSAQGPEAQSKLAPFNANNSSHINEGDDYVWIFNTNDLIDKTGPIVESVTPAPGLPDASLEAFPQAVFNKPILGHSVDKNSVSLSSSDNDFRYWVYSNDKTVYLGHAPFKDKVQYSVQFNQGIKDLYQNCYYPCSGLGVKGNPSCCNGKSCSGNSCDDEKCK